MTGRRSFFKRLAQAAAIVALAPQLCFRTKPETFSLPKPKVVPFWVQTTRSATCISVGYREQLAELCKNNPSFAMASFFSSTK